MILASILGDAFGSVCILAALFLLGARKLLRDSDKDGKIRGAASEGVVRMLGRWLR